jgi:hypothetical protein
MWPRRAAIASSRFIIAIIRLRSAHGHRRTREIGGSTNEPSAIDGALARQALPTLRLPPLSAQLMPHPRFLHYGAGTSR